MFHHPQNIPSIIRTQRLMEQQEYSIIIRRPKEEIDDQGEEYSIIIIIIIRDDPDSRDLFPPYHFGLKFLKNHEAASAASSTTISSLCWLFGWLNPHDLGGFFWCFVCVFLGINGHESLLQITLVCNLRDRERTRPTTPKEASNCHFGFGFCG